MSRSIGKGFRWIVDEKHLDDIPDAPGVYALYYYGKKRYVGQAMNLQRRLTQHFMEDVGFTEFSWCKTAIGEIPNVESRFNDKVFDG